ncbi:MAG: DUF2279 domain-containing protein [Flavobacteriaceae bacterium]|nr:DUF2279 domain-containing protein [Flavobacteriaceae bacterium]
MFVISYLSFVQVCYTQTKFSEFLRPSDTLNISRRNSVIISEAVLFTAGVYGLNELWYKDYPRSNFHTINDGNEWMQMDKIGHAFSSYQLGRLGAESLEWSGVSKKNQLIYGATIGFTFLTAVEVLDGFSKEWGFSWTDMASNAAGTTLFVGQEVLWEEQRILLKYSFHRTKYAKLRPEKLGDGILEESLKDYNGQTYWLSINLKSFFRDSNLPNWLNVALGYGADGMLTGENEPNNLMFPNQNRTRQFYISLDVDLTKIKTNSNILNTIFSIFNVLKVPFPALEFTDKNGIKFHAITI